MELVLSNDDHQLLVDFSGHVLFAESGEQVDYVTVIDLTLDQVERRGSMRVTWSPAFQIIDTARVTPDPEDELDVEIGTTAAELDSRRATIRGKEAAIGNLIGDTMRGDAGECWR